MTERLLESAVSINNLSRRFGTRYALQGVTLSVPAGSIFGLIGENGAGKTTLIRHVLGLLRPQEGAVRVFGGDPTRDPVGVLSQIGYLSEESDLPNWMRLREVIAYVRSFYPTWDESYLASLLRDFDLDTNARMRDLSKGQRARAGLVVALAYRPPLLVLDEPSSGLDPVVRRDVLNTIVRSISSEGRTVLFSSHLLNEVSEVCDDIAMIQRGRIVFCDKKTSLLRRYVKIRVRFGATVGSVPPLFPGVVHWTPISVEWEALYGGDRSEFETALTRSHGIIIDVSEATLEDIFLAFSSRAHAVVEAEV